MKSLALILSFFALQTPSVFASCQDAVNSIFKGMNPRIPISSKLSVSDDGKSAIYGYRSINPGTIQEIKMLLEKEDTQKLRSYGVQYTYNHDSGQSNAPKSGNFLYNAYVKQQSDGNTHLTIAALSLANQGTAVPAVSDHPEYLKVELNSNCLLSEFTLLGTRVSAATCKKVSETIGKVDTKNIKALLEKDNPQKSISEGAIQNVITNCSKGLLMAKLLDYPTLQKKPHPHAKSYDDDVKQAR